MTLIPARLTLLLFLTSIVAGSLITTACSEQSEPADDQGETPTAAAPEPEPEPTPQTVVVGPYVYGADINPKDSKYIKCWAAVGCEPTREFNNSFDSIRGPADVVRLTDLDADGVKKNHADWTGRITHVAAGPTARVTLYEQTELRGNSYTLEPEEEIDLPDIPLDTIASLRIQYVP